MTLPPDLKLVHAVPDPVDRSTEDERAILALVATSDVTSANVEATDDHAGLRSVAAAGAGGDVPPPSPPAQKKAPKPKRSRSGTAAWHMSRRAVSVSLEDVYKLNDAQAMDFLVKNRFGAWDTVRCPHCGTIDKHYWRPAQRRWKCSGCGSTFSVTSQTVFQGRRLRLQQIIAMTLTWMNSAAGQPALESKRHANVSFNTAFVHQAKLREALVRGYNVGLVSGDLEIDGAHQSGWRAAEKRGKPQGSAGISSEASADEVRATMLTQTSQVKARQQGKKRGGKIDPEFGRRLPPNRRILFAIRRRSGVPGRGAVTSRVAIGLVEDSSVAQAVVRCFVATPESVLNTDTSPAYAALGREFREHRTVEHAKMLRGPNGENNNQAEELNWRYDRAEKGIYLNIEAKYMLDYACETGFRSDTRRLPNGEQLKIMLSLAMQVGPSLFWTGFTHGRHRTEELLLPGPQPFPASGPPKGRHPISSANGRPPR